MGNDRSNMKWLVNVVSFILFVVLGLTGLVNWWILPRGNAASSSFLISTRHFLREMHEWAALLFIICIVIHILLHQPYIRTNLKKYGLIK